MKVRTILVIAFAAIASLAWAQETAPQTTPSLHAHQTTAGASDSTSSILSNELPNLKSDLAELRAMLNVLASQESGPDPRTAAALQTKRKMWQIVIARLADITERMEASQQRTGQKSSTPEVPR